MKTEKETIEKTPMPLSYTPKTLLGKKLLEVRARIVASGEQMLEWEAIEKEVRNRRGEAESHT